MVEEEIVEEVVEVVEVEEVGSECPCPDVPPQLPPRGGSHYPAPDRTSIAIRTFSLFSPVCSSSSSVAESSHCSSSHCSSSHIFRSSSSSSRFFVPTPCDVVPDFSAKVAAHHCDWKWSLCGNYVSQDWVDLGCAALILRPVWVWELSRLPFRCVSVLP